MQTLANVLNMPIKVASSDEAPALGAAVYAAVAAGLYPNVIEASKKLGSDFEAEYHPEPEALETYAGLMEEYKELGAFVENNINRKSTVNEL
jgi:L-ribulokinase